MVTVSGISKMTASKTFVGFVEAKELTKTMMGYATSGMTAWA